MIKNISDKAANLLKASIFLPVMLTVVSACLIAHAVVRVVDWSDT